MCTMRSMLERSTYLPKNVGAIEKASLRFSFPTGVGIVVVDRFRAPEYVLVPDELASTVKPESLAGKYAAKIAIAQALGEYPHFLHMEVLKHPEGDPYVKVSDRVQSSLIEKGIAGIPISISHDGGIAVGFAVLDKGDVSNMRVGVDVTVDRPDGLLERHPQKAFTDSEIAEMKGDPEKIKGRWAVKEAIAKILVGRGAPMTRWKTIETYEDSQGLQINTSGISEKFRTLYGIEKWHVSMVREGSASFAFVVAHK